MSPAVKSFSIRAKLTLAAGATSAFALLALTIADFSIARNTAVATVEDSTAALGQGYARLIGDWAEGKSAVVQAMAPAAAASDPMPALLQAKQVRKMIASYVGENKEFERQYLAGELEVELNPQGTLAERIRAGGAGLGGFFTPTGAGTQIAQGKETRVIDGREYVLEKPLKADFAIVRAWKGDRWGNLVFRKTARNFSPMMCTAARVTIAEVEHLVEVGELDPDQIHVPSIYVKRIFQGTGYQKWIEKRTVRSA